MLSQDQRCANPYCGESLVVLYHLDHIVPVASGGTSEDSNLQLLCPTCNMRKGAKDYEEWLEEYVAAIR